MARLNMDDPRVVDALKAWGTPYSWGAGTPGNANSGWPSGVKGLNGGVGYDCSGYAQAVLVRNALLSPDSRDRTAQELYSLCEPVARGDEKVTDLCFYGSSTKSIVHVMVVIGLDACIGATGGGRKDNGMTDRAFVQLQKWAYRPDWLGVFRILR